jgi:esterase/lipase superfamily enzyme
MSRSSGVSEGTVWRWFRQGLCLALLAGGLTGCAGIPDGILRPVAVKTKTSRVNMLAITTRAPSPDAGELFTGERGREVSFVNMVVSIPPGREVGTVQWPSITPGNPATDFVVTDARPLVQKQVADWFSTAKGKKRRVFVYVHGFNTRFDRAVFRFAQLTHDTDAEAAPVLYSWPSRGQLFDYRRDLDNASYSRSELADLLQVAANAPAVSEIVILAHSMGSWVAVEALKQISLRRGRVPAKITNVILASPDLDIGVFRKQLADIGPKRPPITIFVSQEDRALQLSAFLARGLTRLGAVDASREEYQKELQTVSGITILDVTELRSGDRINHSAYTESPYLVRLIGDRLIRGEIVTEEDVSPAETAANAASNLLTAPIRVFQAATRR